MSTSVTAPAPLGYRPALDGVRALAIGLVIMNHIGEPGMTLRFVTGAPSIGVDVFFVLSGFLITRLMLDEHGSNGSINLRQFWIRRALRLLPLAVTVILIVWLLATVSSGLFFRSGAEVSPSRDAIAALTYHMNFLMMSHGMHHIWALTHTWSLSIEEQFYLVWPLLVVASIRFLPWTAAKAVMVTAGTIVVLSAATRAGFWSSPDHVYNGLDSRAGQLCAGALLAGASIALPRAIAFLGRFGWLGLTAVLYCGVRFAIISRWHGISYDMVSMFSIVAIAGVLAHRSALAHVMSNPVLVWAGTRSYALYLVHYPLFLALTPNRFGTTPHIVVMAIRLGAALLLAETANRVIERPAARLRKRMHARASTRSPVSTEIAASH